LIVFNWLSVKHLTFRPAQSNSLTSYVVAIHRPIILSYQIVWGSSISDVSFQTKMAACTADNGTWYPLKGLI
jgi:hypothetical protein